MAPIRWNGCRNRSQNKSQDLRSSVGPKYSGRMISSLLFLLDAVADDVGHVGIAFFLLFDEGGVVEALIPLDFFLVARCSFAFDCRLLALLFCLGIFERDEFGIRRLRHDRFSLRHWRWTCDRCRRRR